MARIPSPTQVDIVETVSGEETAPHRPAPTGQRARHVQEILDGYSMGRQAALHELAKAQRTHRTLD